MHLRPQRVAVIGLAGSGKSTLAARLARRLGGDHIELDQLHWEPNWTPAAPEVFRARVATAVATQCWVACGNYSIVRDLVWARADHIVWLDYSLARVQARVLRRTWHRVIAGQEICNGNREKLGMFFSRDSLLLYNRNALMRHRELYPRLLAEQTTARVVHHTSPRETLAWLSAIATSASDVEISQPDRQ